jgi:short-subunit dehydrogenase
LNKSALITGASSGLGYEFVKLLANDGFNLVLVARNKEKLEEIKKTFTNVEVTVIAKDLTVSGAAKEVFQEVEKKGIKIDALINNAGFGLMGKFDELDIHTQMEMIQLNITTLTELTYYLLPSLKEKRGRILNIGSTAAFQPGPMMAVYFATKAFVLSFSEALVEELRDNNVTVTTLCPGATKTNFGTVANVEGSKMFSRAMEPDQVAKKGYQAMMRGKRVIVTGGLNKVGAIGTKFMPRSVTAKIAKYVTGEK